MSRYILIYTTTSDKEGAEKIAQILLEKRLVACANIFPISSRYWWQGKIEQADECGMLLKTRKELYQKVEKEIKRLHSYTIPAIICWNIEKGSKEFLEWIKKETKSRRERKKIRRLGRI
ncbi:MAG: divalent-cation tolerance protein CutA [Candidatus Edwardsbacteria bacterium]